MTKMLNPGRTHCPECGSELLVVQDFDRLTNSVSMLKLIDRRQLRCENCSWMDFENTDEDELAAANR